MTVLSKRLLIAAFALSACGRDGAARADAERMLRSIDTLITVENDAKAGALAAMTATPCAEPPVCRAKVACSAAFEPLVRAVALKNEARVAMRAPGAAGDMPAIEAKADEAERAQKDSQARMPACLTATTELRRGPGR